MEAWQAQNGPDREETNYQLDHTGRALLNGLNKAFTSLRTEGNVCDDTAKYERCQKRQGNNKAVEKAVIAFAHTVSNPGAVMVKSFNTVVT